VAGLTTRVTPAARDRYPAAKTWKSSPQGDVELMMEKKVLNFKPATRLEQVGDIRSVDDRKHRIG
jgi:hypothetical protein